MDEALRDPDFLAGVVTSLAAIIAAAVGFYGVITTLKSGSRENAKSQQAKFAQDRKNVVHAFQSELKIIFDRLQNYSKAMSKSSKIGHGSLNIYVGNLKDSGMLFQQHIAQIGYLSPDTIEGVCRAYDSVKAIPDLLVVAAQAQQVNSNLNYVLVTNLDAVVKMFEPTLEYLRNAIDKLEADLRVDSGVGG